MSPWSYILGAYLLAAAGLLCYLLSLSRRMKAVNAQRASLKSHGKDRVR